MKCYKCAHYYTIMATTSGYNPFPSCQYWEDTGKRPNILTQECFTPRKRIRKAVAPHD